MTWSISTSGTKQQVRARVSESQAPSDSDRVQHDRAREHILAAVDAAPDDAYVTVSASGHDGQDRSSEALSINATVRA